MKNDSTKGVIIPYADIEGYDGSAVKSNAPIAKTAALIALPLIFYLFLSLYTIIPIPLFAIGYFYYSLRVYLKVYKEEDKEMTKFIKEQLQGYDILADMNNIDLIGDDSWTYTNGSKSMVMEITPHMQMDPDLLSVKVQTFLDSVDGLAASKDIYFFQTALEDVYNPNIRHGVYADEDIASARFKHNMDIVDSIGVAGGDYRIYIVFNFLAFEFVSARLKLFDVVNNPNLKKSFKSFEIVSDANQLAEFISRSMNGLIDRETLLELKYKETIKGVPEPKITVKYRKEEEYR